MKSLWLDDDHLSKNKNKTKNPTNQQTNKKTWKKQKSIPLEKPYSGEPCRHCSRELSELVPWRRSVQRSWRWQCFCVLAVDVSLLPGLPGVCPVPVSGHCLVVPDGWRFCVAQIARLARVVRGVDEQRLRGEGFQVPGFVKLLVLGSATRSAQVCEGGRLGEQGRTLKPCGFILHFAKLYRL